MKQCADSRAERLAHLLVASGEGDRAAFTKLHEETTSALHRVALRIVRRRDLAEEAVQDAYFRIWRRAKTFDPQRGSAIVWMTTIARHRALDIIKLKAEVALEDIEWAVEIAGDWKSPEASAILRDEVRRLSACLDELGAERGSAVVLAYGEDWSREELSARFGRPVSTIKTLLRRSLIRLRRSLAVGR